MNIPLYYFSEVSPSGEYFAIMFDVVTKACLLVKVSDKSFEPEKRPTLSCKDIGINLYIYKPALSHVLYVITKEDLTALEEMGYSSAEEILLICRRQEAHKQCLNQNIVYEWKGIKNA